MRPAQLELSPGWGRIVALGPTQARALRAVRRELAGRDSTRAGVRRMAARAGIGAGTMSRSLDALMRLGFVVHATRRGRRGFVELFACVRRWAGRLAAPRARRRSLARFVPAGQLMLTPAEALATSSP